MATNYKEYIESEAVKQAKAALEAQQAQKPGAYTSQWQQQLNDTLDKIQNREKFQYDLNGDALYQQYKDRYIQQGQQAMMDTMGQAVALTGGYGNSYAQTVGQQTYHGYLQGLNDKVPELYQLALDRYNQETNDLYTKFGLYDTMEQKDYGRYQDSMNEFNAQLEYLTGRYDAERDYDYGKYADDRNFSYQVERDTIADQQWQKEFDEAVRQYNESMAAKSSGGGSGGGGGGSVATPAGSKTPSYNNGNLTTAQVMELQSYYGVDANGMWTNTSIGADDAWAKYQKDTGQTSSYSSVEGNVIQLRNAGYDNATIRNVILQASREGLISVEQARYLNSVYAGVNYNK